MWWIIFSLRTEITERSALIVFFGCSNLSIPIDTIDTIYQLFWCSRGAQGFDPFPCIANKCKKSEPSEATGFTAQHSTFFHERGLHESCQQSPSRVFWRSFLERFWTVSQYIYINLYHKSCYYIAMFPHFSLFLHDIPARKQLQKWKFPNTSGVQMGHRLWICVSAGDVWRCRILYAESFSG